jgi:hypothetical protein
VSAVLDLATDLELVAGLEAAPDYVLAWTPPWAYGRIRDRLRRPGFWELLTFEEYQEGAWAPDERTTERGADCGQAVLVAWAGSLLGYPVALEHDERYLKIPGLFSLWVQVPLYWVRRNT